MSKVIVWATPVFLLLIALEFWVSRRRTRVAGARAGAPLAPAFGLADSINSLSLGVLSQLAGLLSKALSIGIYTLVFEAVALWPDSGFWTTWYGVLAALLLYDFCYYWLHRAGHEVAVLWAAHVVHHQSQHYNLTTALRQTSSGVLLGWVFYLPLAVLGVPPLVFGIVALIDLLYQFWVHTELVGRLGWFDRVFCSPSNHRVHHAINAGYLDRNYGGILVLWDRLFGTFAVETEPCVYGTRSPLNSWDPLWANLKVYRALARDSWRTRRWRDKLRIWLQPPGWLPDDLAAHHPKKAFAMKDVPRYAPPLSPQQQGFAVLQFAATLGAALLLLWHADGMAPVPTLLAVAGLVCAIWGTGRFLQNQLAALEVLLLDAAVLATLASVPGGVAFWWLKPLPMLLGIAFVLQRAWRLGPLQRSDVLLACALLASLAGDVLLMLPGNFFVPGLAAFMAAHLAYLAMLRQGQPWFAHRRALAAVLTIGGLMFLVLAPTLWPQPVLAGAVLAYVLVISLMCAQALGRASVLQDEAARWLALGACLFMLSDSLIAINKFLTPLPLASVWVLSTYFAAQMLIMHNARPPGAR